MLIHLAGDDDDGDNDGIYLGMAASIILNLVWRGVKDFGFVGWMEDDDVGFVSLLFLSYSSSDAIGLMELLVEGWRESDELLMMGSVREIGTGLMELEFVESLRGADADADDDDEEVVLNISKSGWRVEDSKILLCAGLDEEVE